MARKTQIRAEATIINRAESIFSFSLSNLKVGTIILCETRAETLNKYYQWWQELLRLELQKKSQMQMTGGIFQPP